MATLTAKQVDLLRAQAMLDLGDDPLGYYLETNAPSASERLETAKNSIHAFEILGGVGGGGSIVLAVDQMAAIKSVIEAGGKWHRQVVQDCEHNGELEALECHRRELAAFDEMFDLFLTERQVA